MQYLDRSFLYADTHFYWGVALVLYGYKNMSFV